MEGAGAGEQKLENSGMGPGLIAVAGLGAFSQSQREEC